MRLALLLYFLILFAPNTAFAQFQYVAGAEGVALAGNSICNSDVWAVHNNPAALYKNNLQVGIWTERLYNLKELSRGAFSLSMPLAKQRGAVGVGMAVLSYFENTRIEKYNLAFALALNKKLNIGISAHLLNIHYIHDYGRKLLPIGEIALLHEINKRTSLGIRIYNVYPIKISAYPVEYLPVLLAAGIKHDLNPKIHLYAQFSHAFPSKNSLHFGVSYRVHDKITLMAGILTNPFQYAFGTHFRVADKLNIQIACSVHPVLGPSSNLSLMYGQATN